jgi:hypothetical protein
MECILRIKKKKLLLYNINPNKINMKAPMKKMAAVKKAVKEMPAPMKKAMAMKKMMAMKKSK